VADTGAHSATSAALSGPADAVPAPYDSALPMSASTPIMPSMRARELR